MIPRNNKSYKIVTNLQNVKVIHRNEGAGIVISHETQDNDSSYIKVHYDNGKIMEHKYPDSFFHNDTIEAWLTCEDESIINKIFEDINHLGMKEAELADERYENNQRIIENNRIKKEVKFEDFIIAKNDFRCRKNKHNVVDIIATIQVLEIGIGIKDENINGWYCNDCNIFYIDNVDYNKLRHKGILMCKNMVEDQYLKMKKNTNLNAFYSQESILHEYGYNVSEQDNLTDDERERILAMLVDMKVVSRESIKYFLNNLIFRFGRQNKDYSGAIEKWERDINFICNYKIDSLTKYGIRSLRK